MVYHIYLHSLTNDLNIAKIFIGRVIESVFIIPMILLHLILFCHLCVGLNQGYNLKQGQSVFVKV